MRVLPRGQYIEWYKAFNWKNLPSNSVVVDVAGGVGTSAFPLARGYPELKIVIQDLPGVIEEASKVQLHKML